MKSIVRWIGVAGALVVGATAAYAQGPNLSEERAAKDYLGWLLKSNDALAKRIRAEIAAGPTDLARERKACYVDGTALTTPDLRKYVPPDENAAPLYLRIGALLKKKSAADPKAEEVANGINYASNPTPAQVATLREYLRNRADAMALIRAAGIKPGCNIRADWSVNLTPMFDHYTAMRQACRLIRSQAFLLALDGKFDEAVQTQALGYRVARHIASDPTILSHLVTLAINTTTNRGMADILQVAGPNPRVDELVANTVSVNRSDLGLRRALRGEMVVVLTSIGAAAYANVENMDELKSALAKEDKKLKNPKAMKSEVERWQQNLVCAQQAAIIHKYREIIKTAGMVYPYQIPDMAKACENAGDPLDPVYTFVNMGLGTLRGLSSKDARARAEGELVTAAAGLLGYRAKNGAFPEKLADEFKEIPCDPFEGEAYGYRREGEGFVIYSIGETGKFDGGKPGEASAGKEALFRYTPKTQ